MLRPLACTAAVVVVVLAGAPAATAASAPAHTVGAVSVHRCNLNTERTAWCGAIRTPLDYTDPRAGTITIGFGWLPSVGAARGTVVAQEGGPGYPSTGT